MPDISYAQTNFSGGEVSPPFRGRLDEKEYPLALTQCLNYIPNQENSLSPRSGFKRIGPTKAGAPAKLLPFRFNYYEPYVSEFTANNLRFYANGLPIFRAVYATLTNVSGDPPTFTVSSSLAGDTNIPTTWANHNSVYIQLATNAAVQTYGYLANREFKINIVSRSSGTFTLTDAETGNALTGAITFATIGTPRIYCIIDHSTYWSFVDDIRQVQFTSQTLIRPANTSLSPAGDLTTVTGPEHKVSYLQSITSPRSISKNKGLDYGIIREDFIDGPYLDSIGDNVPATVSGTSGSITVTLHGYSAAIRYVVGDLAYNGSGSWSVSIKAPNIGNAPTTVSPFITAYWATLPATGWSSITTYALGQMIFAGPFDVFGKPTVYYSLQASNLNHDPTSSPTFWSTTPVTWDIAATYPAFAVVIDSAIRYVSVSVPVVGTHPAAAPTVWYAISNTFFEDAAAGVYGENGFLNVGILSTIFDAGDAAQNSPGRLIRLKGAPQPWSPTWAYSASDFVNFKDNIYKALGSTTGDIPDQSPTKWEIQIKTIWWTWGQITHVTDQFTATVLIKGDALPDANPVFEWRLGLFSDALGWPRCGVYHEGRLGFAAGIPNRIDLGRPNLGYDFTPTAPDGTVADNNAISYILNSAEDERIMSFGSTAEGIATFTSEREWLISASNLNDPLTPTSIQAHPVTSFGSTDKEAAILPSGLAFIQSGRRRIMEFRSFVDTTNYQSRLNAIDLTRKCQHLSVDGVRETYYQRLPQPVIWALPCGVITGVTTPDTCPPAGVWIKETTADPRGKLFGLGYSRSPEVSYVAPFSFEHGFDYKTVYSSAFDSISVQRGNIDTAEYLYGSLARTDTGLSYMEMLMPVFESFPLDDTYNNDGTVHQFGTLSGAFFLDSGITPAGCKIATNGLSVTFYGLHAHASETVSFTCRGKYVGDYAIASDGSVVVTFITGVFEKTDIGRAMYTVPNATLVSATLQSFFLDVNGNTGVLNPAASTTGFYGVFGYAFRRRGQQLRPPIEGRNGSGFAKFRQNARVGIYLDAGQEVSVGNTFDAANLKPFKLVVPGPEGKIGSVAPTNSDFVTGIFRQEVDDDYTFDGNLCWEQTRPVPGAILAVGGFIEISDV